MNICTARILSGTTLLTLAVALTGCVVSIGGSRTHEAPKASSVVVVDSADNATIEEISAAGKLSHDSARANALSQIAGRAALSSTVQVHLVNTAYKNLSSDSTKTDVLVQMIGRADFGDAARHAIVSQLHKLSFDSNRELILQKINDRLKPAGNP